MLRTNGDGPFACPPLKQCAAPRARGGGGVLYTGPPWRSLGAIFFVAAGTMAKASVSRARGSCGEIGEASSCQAGGDGGGIGSNGEPSSTTPDGQRAQQQHVDELSERAVKLLDEELAELEQLIRLQKRKVDALERLRQQWLSGARYLASIRRRPPCWSVTW